MTTLEAIYENGIFKPISAVPQTLKEHERVRITVESKTEEDLQAEVVQQGRAGNRDLKNKFRPQILREMLADGIISHIPEGISDEEDDFEPVKMKGRLISETLLEDRN